MTGTKPGLSQRRLHRWCLLAVALVAALSPVLAPGNDDNSELATWYEQAYSYYTAVQAGVVAKPDPPAWQEFMNQMQWAQEQLYGSSTPDPVGEIQGAQGNMEDRAAQTRIGFTGKAGHHNIWSHDVTLLVPSMAASVTVTHARDSSVQPPERVLKVIVSDPATGTSSTYILHDVDDIDLKIQTPDPGQVSDRTGIAKIETFLANMPGPAPVASGMRDTNLSMIALQSKVQTVSQQTQMTSNIAKSDSDAKLNVIRNMRATQPDEAASVLQSAPDAQVGWARSYLASRTSVATRAEIEAAVSRAFGRDSTGMKAQAALITQIEQSGAVLNALPNCSDGKNSQHPACTAAAMQAVSELSSTRSRVIRNFAQKKPPRAYADNQPQPAARAQDSAQRYTQYVQLSTQLMGELQNTERELVDTLQTMKRDLDNLWQGYASLRDNEFRTDERVMTTR